MSSSADIIKKVNTTYKSKIASQGCEQDDVTRLATGAFAFDLASGGGFPVGFPSIVFGPESSCKTSLVLKAVANAQRRFPERKAVFADVEGHFDKTWAAHMGVDVDALVYFRPDFAEQAIDIIEQFLYASDVSVVAVDSLAAFIPMHEVENSAEKQSVGRAGLLTSQMYRKVTRALNHVRNVELRVPPSLLMINQIRHKIGVMHGDPETMPGGNSWKFGSTLTVRLYGKDRMEKTIHPHLPAFKEIRGVIRKHKVPIMAKSFQFDLAVVNAPDHGLKIGDTSDWPTFHSYMRAQELIVKGDKKGWQMFAFDGEGSMLEFPTLEACAQHFASDQAYSDLAKAGLVQHLSTNGVVLAGDAEAA